MGTAYNRKVEGSQERGGGGGNINIHSLIMYRMSDTALARCVLASLLAHMGSDTDRGRHHVDALIPAVPTNSFACVPVYIHSNIGWLGN